MQFTQSLQLFQREEILTVTFGSLKPHIVWHGVKLGQPDWSHDSHSLAFTLRHPEAGEQLHVILNAYWKPLIFELPPLYKGEAWHRVVDTALASPNDIVLPSASPPDASPKVNGNIYLVGAQSAVVLMVAVAVS